MRSSFGTYWQLSWLFTTFEGVVHTMQFIRLSWYQQHLQSSPVTCTLDWLATLNCPMMWLWKVVCLSALPLWSTGDSSRVYTHHLSSLAQWRFTAPLWEATVQRGTPLWCPRSKRHVEVKRQCPFKVYLKSPLRIEKIKPCLDYKVNYNEVWLSCRNKMDNSSVLCVCVGVQV